MAGPNHHWREYIQVLRTFHVHLTQPNILVCFLCDRYVGKGCTHSCAYCNVAHRFVPRLQRNPNTERYRDGFAVRLFEGELGNPSYRRSGAGFVFIWYMGDWLGDAVPDEWILRILDIVRADPGNQFLSCTKNAPRYLELADEYGWDLFPENLWFGTTIESNLPLANGYSKAPPVEERYGAMVEVSRRRDKIFLSIEPKLDCEPEGFLGWVEDMNVKVCEIGADNYRVVELPEPSAWKAQRMLDGLNSIVPLVVTKRGFERLLPRGAGNGG